MELRHMRYFVAVAKEGGFAKAAAQLNVAQPALSRQVMDLEHELGVTLFERMPQGTRLTAEGKRFLADAQKVLAAADRAVSRARSARRRRDVGLSLGYGELLAHWQEVSSVFHRFRQAYPKVPLQAIPMTRPELQSALREDRVHMGIIGMSRWPPRGFDGVRLIPASMTGVLLADSHPLAQKASVRFSDLRELTWYHLRPEATWDAFAYMLERIRGEGFTGAHRSARAGSFAFLPQIAAGAGWALANETLRAAVMGSTEGLTYRPLAEEPLEIWVTAIWKKGGLTPEIRSFVDVACAMCKSAGAPLSRTAAARRA